MVKFTSERDIKFKRALVVLGYWISQLPKRIIESNSIITLA
jgi:hypothetical protein